MVVKYVKEFEFPDSKTHVSAYSRGGPTRKAKDGKVRRKADGGAVSIPMSDPMSDLMTAAPRVPMKMAPKSRMSVAPRAPLVGPSRAKFDALMAVKKAAADKTANFGQTPAERNQLAGSEGVGPLSGALIGRKNGGKVGKK
jgi:hypothetical protein